MLIGNDFDTEVGQLIVEKYLGRGKSGDSYLVNLNERNYVLKIMHDEKVGYYQWNKSKLTDEIKSYKTLSKLRVPIPKLHYADFEKNFLIKDYINGNIASKIIAEKRITELHIQKLFEISNHLKKHNINIDYFPNNFVFTNKEIFYIDYEHNLFDKKWSLENWGIYYWANSEGFKNFLKTGNPKFINSNLEKGIPPKKPFQKIVRKWISEYST